MKLGEWQLNLQGINESTIPKVLQYYSAATEHDRNWYKVSKGKLPGSTGERSVSLIISHAAGKQEMLRGRSPITICLAGLKKTNLTTTKNKPEKATQGNRGILV